MPSKFAKQKAKTFVSVSLLRGQFAMRSLPPSAWSSKLLHRCLALLVALEGLDALMGAADGLGEDGFEVARLNGFQDFHDKRWPNSSHPSLEEFLHRTFASMTLEVVRQKMDARTIEEAFPVNGNGEKVKGDLWKLVNGHPHSRGSNCIIGGLEFGLGAELMEALINKGLPKWYWASLLGPYNDNLLQYILAPLAARPMEWIGEGNSSKTERFSLEELCREDEEGENAFSHAGCLRDFFDGRREDGGDLWIQLYSEMARLLVPHVREFQGSLPKLIDLAQSVQYGLDGNLPLLRTFFCDIRCSSMFWLNSKS